MTRRRTGDRHAFRCLCHLGGGAETNDAIQAVDITCTAQAPTDLAAAPGDGQTILTWDAAPGNNSYTVERSLTSGGPYTTVVSGCDPGGSDTLTYLDSGLTDGTTYYYVVQAVNAGGPGPASNEASVTPVAAPPAPASLTAVPGDGQVALSWGAVAGASGYDLERSATSGGPYTTVGQTTDTQATDAGLTDGTTYFYVVRAVGTAGSGPLSNEASATPTAGEPAPASLTATPGDGQVSLSWAGADPAASYTVARSLTPGGPYAPVGTVAAGNGTTYVDTGLTDGTAYFYVVSAQGPGGTSGPCAEATAVPLAVVTSAPAGQNYGYTGDGLRAWKQPPGPGPTARTYFLYDPDTDQPVAEMDAAGNVTAVNVWGATGLLSRRGLSASSSVGMAGSVFYDFDPSGSVAQRLDGNGDVLGAYAFDAYGLRQGTDTASDPYLYFGGQYGYYEDAETGLELLTRRYYDPGQGRFVTRDPIRYGGGVNIYSYAGNNPINYNDPSGMRRYYIHSPLHPAYVLDIPNSQDVDDK